MSYAKIEIAVKKYECAITTRGPSPEALEVRHTFSTTYSARVEYDTVEELDWMTRSLAKKCLDDTKREILNAKLPWVLPELESVPAVVPPPANLPPAAATPGV